MKKWGITGVTTLTPDEVIYDSTVLIGNDKIEKVAEGEIKTAILASVEEGILLPGFINAHDHLIGNYYPKVGNGPYENWLPWDNDLKSSPLYQERQQIENRDLHMLGAYRNLVSGVTTVSDHIPQFVHDPFLDLMPVRVIRDYALVHSISSFALLWGESIDAEYRKAIERDIPFITHIAEGYDLETKRDVEVLDRMGGLGDHSVLVHGLAFSDSDIALIAKRGASTVWCADSNMFMFNRTGRVKEWLDAGINVCIGTDSPMSGGLNILYEMKFDKEIYRNLYGKDIADKTLVQMVTKNPAKAFHIKKTGHVKNGYIADLLVLRRRDSNPYRSVVVSELADVQLVIIGGMPVYGSGEHRSVFDALGVKYQEITLAGEERLVVGDLKGLLRRISHAVGFKKEFPFLPVDFEI